MEYDKINNLLLSEDNESEGTITVMAPRVSNNANSIRDKR